MDYHKPRIYNIDFLRGIAVTMVLILHASSSTLPFIKESPLHQIFYFGKYGVQIFFVISGYIICYSLFHSNYKINNFLKFIAKRFIRLNPLAYVVLIVYLTIEYFIFLVSGNHLILSNPFDCKLLVANFFFLSNTLELDYYLDTFWTLEIELQFYLIIGIIFPLLTYKSLIVRLLTILLMVIFCISNLHITLSGNILYFLFGIVYFQFQFKLIDKYILTFLFILFSYIFLRNAQYIELLFSFFSLLFIAIKNPVKNKLFQFMGKISFSLYVVHLFIFIYLDIIINKLNLNQLHESIPTKILMTLIYSVIAIFISNIFYNYIEKPFINYSKKISWKSF